MQSAKTASNQSNNQTAPKKTDLTKTKPTYKHIPHSQKPVEVVMKRNTRERNRVQKVNQAFHLLRRSVPIENRNKRVSKVKTLQRAIDYIRKLERILATADQQPESSSDNVVATCQQQQQNQPAVSATNRRKSHCDLNPTRQTKPTKQAKPVQQQVAVVEQPQPTYSTSLAQPQQIYQQQTYTNSQPDSNYYTTVSQEYAGQYASVQPAAGSEHSCYSGGFYTPTSYPTATPANPQQQFGSPNFVAPSSNQEIQVWPHSVESPHSTAHHLSSGRVAGAVGTGGGGTSLLPDSTTFALLQSPSSLSTSSSTCASSSSPSSTSRGSSSSSGENASTVGRRSLATSQKSTASSFSFEAAAAYLVANGGGSGGQQQASRMAARASGHLQPTTSTTQTTNGAYQLLLDNHQSGRQQSGNHQTAAATLQNHQVSCNANINNQTGSYQQSNYHRQHQLNQPAPQLSYEHFSIDCTSGGGSGTISAGNSSSQAQSTAPPMMPVPVHQIAEYATLT